MTRKQDVDSESPQTDDSAFRAVQACLARVHACEERVEATAGLLAELAERLVLDQTGNQEDLVLMARNHRKAKASLRYAFGALDQANQEASA